MWLKKLIYRLYKYYYPTWCKIYQFIYERDYISKPINHSKRSPDEAQKLLNKLTWKPDSIAEFKDAAHHPAYVSAVLSQNIEYDSMDCEDFALFGASIVEKFYFPEILTVTWSTGFWPWQMSGHAVCMVRNNTCGNIGNFGASLNIGSMYDNIDLILAKCGIEQKDMVGCTIYNPEDLCYGGLK